VSFQSNRNTYPSTAGTMSMCQYHVSCATKHRQPIEFARRSNTTEEALLARLEERDRAFSPSFHAREKETNSLWRLMAKCTRQELGPTTETVPLLGIDLVNHSMYLWTGSVSDWCWASASSLRLRAFQSSSPYNNTADRLLPPSRG